MLTSGVTISLIINFRISFNSARGARFLKLTPWMCLWMLMVCSLVTTLLMAEQPFFSPLFFAGAIMPGPNAKGRAQDVVGEEKQGRMHNFRVTT